MKIKSELTVRGLPRPPLSTRATRLAWLASGEAVLAGWPASPAKRPEWPSNDRREALAAPEGANAPEKPRRGHRGPTKPLRGFVLPTLGKELLTCCASRNFFWRKRACQALAGHFLELFRFGIRRRNPGYKAE